MSKRVLGVAVVAVALAGCAQGSPSPPEPEPEPEASAGVYAYGTVEFGATITDTRSEMHVMDGTEEIGTSGPLLLTSRPAFTTNGKYAFTLPSYTDEIIAISVDSGKTVTVPCAGCNDRQTACICDLLAPIGGNEIAWLDGPTNELVLVDLAAEPPTPERTGITVPTEDGFLDEKLAPNLIGGTEDAVVASYPRGLPGDDLRPTYLVPREGELRRLAPDRPDATEQAVFSAYGTQVALTGTQEYICATVTVADVATGVGTTAPVSAEPGTTCEMIDAYVDSLWWDRDGSLNAVIELDSDATPEGTTAKNGQRRLEDGRWVDTGTGDEVRQLSGGTATIEGDAPGRLVVETDGERTEIDTDVRYLTVAP